MLIDEIRKLSVAERIELVEQIWNTIANGSETIELTESQKEELNRRLASWQTDPSAGHSWEEVRQRLLHW